MRKRVSATELHDLLTREVRNLAGDPCTRCRIPMPTYFAGAREGPNWRIGACEECPSLCHAVVMDAAQRLARRYDLRS